MSDPAAIEFLTALRAAVKEFGKAQEVSDPLLMNRLRVYIHRGCISAKAGNVFPILTAPPETIDRVLERAIVFAERA